MSSSATFLNTWKTISNRLAPMATSTLTQTDLSNIDTSVNELLNDIRDYVYHNHPTLDIISDVTKATTLNYDMTDLYQYAFYKNIGLLISLGCAFIIIKNYHTINGVNLSSIV